MRLQRTKFSAGSLSVINTDEPFTLKNERDILALRDALGFSDWPAREAHNGVLFRGVSVHNTHRIILVCTVLDFGQGWFAFGLPKSKYTRDLAERSMIEVVTPEFGILGPIFGE